MADPITYSNSERDIEQALLALKKGAQLVKYSRKGKPKFCPFRISPDETTLIWYSRKKERTLKLSSVSKIILGQRTPVFNRFPCREKDHLSFSLLYNNGERTLDLICRDKVEAEVWFSGLKALIYTGYRNRRTQSYIPDLYDAGDFFQSSRSSSASLESSPSLPRSINTKFAVSSGEPPLFLTGSDVVSSAASMQLRTSTDGIRLSVSSAPSCSSQGSGPDDIESLGDVYVWGEVLCDGNLTDGPGNSYVSKTDVLLPKPLESNVVLDVNQIASGVRHAALVTRQGEVFTWGEESGGQLGHGVDKDFCRPKLVEFLAVNNVEYIACGEYHTCAISVAGDLFTWGDGTHNVGLLGHATGISHWIPKRVSGPLEGLQVLSVACGSWHSALVTFDGRLFTFGEGTFGVLGHGNRESVTYPREVGSLSGLKTIKVSCGVWHTAAVIEVMGQTGGNISSKKLFTWGDGEKYRLGQGDKETRLIPTCIPSLVDYNFQQIACGHNLTVALTTSGHVFTMGSTSYGQLGNAQSDGKLPCLVQDKLVGQFVEEISCGASHVAILTSRSELFTWGKGANGRLGHGDIENRKGPTLVEALKDRNVKSISCGSNFTACICIHKWVSGADQSLCSGCRQAFGFTKKRHNCYNCGLVHCHACSSKKALRAALAPTPGKPHRVCDACHAKLKASDSGSISTSLEKNVTPRRSVDNRDKFDGGDLIRSSKIFFPATMERYCEGRSKHGKSDSISIMQSSQVPSLLQLKDIALPSRISALQSSLKPVTTSQPQTAMTPIPVSAYPRKPSPPRAAPIFSKGVIDSLKKTNELLNQEVLKLQGQVKSLKQKQELQDKELQNSVKSCQEASSVAGDKSTKCNVAKEVLKSIITQLKDMMDKIPPEVYDNDSLKAMHLEIENFLKTNGSHASDLPTDCSDTEHPSLLYKSSLVNGQSVGNGSRAPTNPAGRNEGEKQVVEQFEPGVYVTLVQLQNGTKVFKRVKFSKSRFNGQQAEDWWRENSSKLLQKYNHNTTNHQQETDTSQSESTAVEASTSEEASVASSEA